MLRCCGMVRGGLVINFFTRLAPKTIKKVLPSLPCYYPQQRNISLISSSYTVAAFFLLRNIRNKSTEICGDVADVTQLLRIDLTVPQHYKNEILSKSSLVFVGRYRLQTSSKSDQRYPLNTPFSKRRSRLLIPYSDNRVDTCRGVIGLPRL